MHFFCTLMVVHVSFSFVTSHGGNLPPPVTRGDTSWFHIHLCRGSAQALKRPGSEGALSFSPVLPALKSSMSGCPFKDGSVGLAPPKIYVVVGAPM
jgi:hypothetical protein